MSLNKLNYFKLFCNAYKKNLNIKDVFVKFLTTTSHSKEVMRF